jgi:2-C-methyl-D-erythritol 4-phosphate cytidylyltransferase
VILEARKGHGAIAALPVVDTLKEKGKWQETFQVTLSLCDVVSSSFVSV